MQRTIFFSVIVAILIIFLSTYLREDFVYFVRSKTSESKEVEIKKTDYASLGWSQIPLATPWSRRDTFAAVVFKDELFVMGGLEGKDGSKAYWEMIHKNDVWKTKDGFEWKSVLSSAPWSKRRSPLALVFKDKLWLTGGWNNDSFKTLNDVWSSEDGLNWSLVASKTEWSGREGHQGVVFNDKIWVMGGVDFNERKAKNDVWYSEDGISWNLALESAPWTPRYGHAIAVFKNSLWLVGGLAPDQSEKNDLWRSEDGINWTLVTNNPPWLGRHDPGFVVFENKLWIIGGWNDSVANSGLNDVWFSEDGINWHKTAENGPWAGREDHGVVVFKDKIWILGGMDKDWKWRNDVWFSYFAE